MLHIQLVALALATTTALAVYGCGGSSKTTSTAATSAATATHQATTPPAAPKEAEIKIKTGKPLTRAAWIAKGDAICTRINEKLAASRNATEQDLGRDLPLAAEYDRLEAAELSKLVPPPNMASDWSQIVNGFQKFAAYTATAAGYAQTNKLPQATSIIVAGNAVQKKLTAIARRDGFKECSVA